MFLLRKKKIMKLIRSKLSDKREKKLSYDYNYIEEKIQTFLEKYHVDKEMETFIQKMIDEEIDLDKAYANITAKKIDKEPQIQVVFFEKIKVKLEDFIVDCIKQEINEVQETEGEQIAIETEEILMNTLETIPLTMFEDGIKRPTLVAYHYFLKVLHQNTEKYMQVNSIKKIKGIKNPNEILANEIYNVVGKDKEMIRFTLTIKNLIEQWLVKYSSKTKIGDFYYDILMITPEYIVEKILKYLIMVAIRNKNPMTLRAIFSSYITLIHKNLFSYYATNLSKVKVGYFKQLENLFTENFDLLHDKGENKDPKKFIMDILIKTYLMKNKRYLKEDMDFLNDEYYQHFFEINYFDAMSSYKYDGNMSLLDHMYFYNTVYKYTKNSSDVYGTSNTLNNKYIVNSEFFKKSNKKKNLLYIQEKLSKKLFAHFYNLFGDKDSVMEILESMAKDIIKKLNFNYYLDEDLKSVEFNFNEYLDNIDYFIDRIEKVVLRDTSIKSNVNVLALPSL